MDPQQIAAVKAIADVINGLGAMPVGTLVVCLIFGPWIALSYITWQQRRSIDQMVKEHEKRFESVVRMYESNVRLVEDCEKLANAFRSVIDGQQDLIIHNTRSMTEVKDAITNNLFCPMIKDRAKPKEPHG